MNVTYQNGWASSGRLDVDDLIEWLRSEAEISDRPGQLDRLNAIADELAAAQAEARELQRRVVELEQQLAAAQAEIECEERRFSEQQDLLHSVIQERDAAQAEVRELQRVQSDVLANLDAPDDMDVISAAHFVAGSLTTAEEALEAAQAEARNWKRIAEDATHVEREELTRVREIVSGMREYADSCDHPSEASKRNAVEYWLTQLEDALSQPAEQHATRPQLRPHRHR